MPRNVNSKLRAAMLMLPLMLAAGCAHKSTVLPPLVEPPAIPALPQAARQPTPPPICSPTCSAGLTRLRKELLDMLTKPAPQD